MAITENLKKILAAVYGRDVRQAIHDGIAGCDENIKAECSNREKAEQEFATEIQNLEKKEKEEGESRMASPIIPYKDNGQTDHKTEE